jgi:hypothetical protein
MAKAFAGKRNNKALSLALFSQYVSILYSGDRAATAPSEEQKPPTLGERRGKEAARCVSVA